MHSVITANLLRTGDVVYLTRNGTWARSLTDAAVVATPDQLAASEAIAAKAVSARHVTAVYAFPVTVTDGRPAPQSIREKIRASHAPAL